MSALLKFARVLVSALPAAASRRTKKFLYAALEVRNQKNQIDCRQPLRVGLAELGALPFGASVPMLL